MAYEVATATVSIIPNMKGSQETIAKELGASTDKAGTSAGKSLGKSLLAGATAVGVGAAIGKFIGDSVNEGAKLQQSLGGIETLFKENADVVKGYASEAYKTAGISANEYMENVTSFSAALISSMDGDTAAAAEMANTAMVDMADNANKMGTDMKSIQTAYQGFAKGNYTMLDNLKLGYGGTKTEMERLLADASKLSGVKYDISNLNDVYSAIHVIQEDLGITGTTAKEAATTFSGSFASMKAAAKDLMGNLALGNDIGPQIEALGSTVGTFVMGNLLPMVSNIAQQIPTILGQLPGMLASALPQILPMAGELVSGLANGIIDNLPVFADGVAQLITNAGDLFANADWAGIGANVVSMLNDGWSTLADAAQTVWDSATKVFLQTIETVPILSDAWNALVDVAGPIWDAVVEVFGGEISVKGILTGAWDVITTTAGNIWDSVCKVYNGEVSVGEVLTSAWDSLTETATNVWNTTKAIFENVAPHAAAVVTTAWNSLKKTASSLWNSAKKVFEGAAPAVKSITLTAWGTIASTAETLFNAAKSKFESVAPAVKAVVTTAWDTLTTTAGTIWDAVKDIFANFEIEWPDFGQLASAAFEGLKNAAKSAWDWVKSLFGGGAGDETVEAVHGSTAEMEAALAECNLVVSDVDISSIETANGLVEDATSHWELLVNGMSLALPTIDASSIGIADGIISSAVSSWQGAMNFSWSLPALHGTLPVISVSMRSVSSSDGKTTVSYPEFSAGTKWFAKGAIFDQPTIIGVGEAGAEAALPLDQFWRRLDAEFSENGGSGATINNYIEINGATDPVAYADELARELQQQLKRA
jgi:phage-related protein